MPETVYSTREAAAQLGVDEITVRRYCEDGIMGVKYANRWHIFQAEIDAKRERPKKSLGPAPNLELHANIERLLNEGVAYRTIAEQLECSPSTVYAVSIRWKKKDAALRATLPSAADGPAGSDSPDRTQGDKSSAGPSNANGGSTVPVVSVTSITTR